MYYPRTGNEPLINGPTSCGIGVWEGIWIINTTTTENDTQDDKYASDDGEYAYIPDLAAQRNYVSDSDD